MSTNFGDVIATVWLILCLFLFGYYFYSRNKKIASNKKLIENAYKMRHILGEFDPLLAVIVRDRYEVVSDNGALELHRICRSNGTYYLFICTAGNPGYLTKLSDERVINALRSSPEILQKEFPNAS